LTGVLWYSSCDNWSSAAIDGYVEQYATYAIAIIA